MKKIPKFNPNPGGLARCEFCKNVLYDTYCTANVCEKCCKSGACRRRYECKAYPNILEELLKIKKDQVIANPSKRVELV